MGDRFYNVDGARYPSVTTILKNTGTSKYKLANWLKNPENRALGEAAKDRGTLIHEVSELYLKGKRGQKITPEHRELWRRLRRELHLVSPRFTELPVSHASLKYAGTLDLYATHWRRLDRVLLDIKTCTDIGNLDHKLGDWRLQIAAYAGALESSRGIAPQYGAVIAVSDQGLKRFIFTREEMAESFLEFRARLEQFHAQKEAEAKKEEDARTVTTAFSFG